jgi:hypothetical protein
MSGRDLSRVERAACLIVGADADILGREQTPMRDRTVIVGEAMLLGLVAFASGVMWALFWSQFASVPVGFCAGVFFCAFILLIDRAVGMAEWTLSGILRRPGLRHGNDHWARLALRGAMTLSLSYGTSTGATMVMFHTAIQREVEHNRFDQNKQITAYYDGLKADTRKQALGPLIGEADRLKGIVADTSKGLDAARLDRSNALSRQQIADTEADRELHGRPGYVAGGGPKYRDALKQRQEADTALAKADAQIAIYDPRLADARSKIDAVNASLQAGEARISGDMTKLEDQKQAQLIPPGYDALMGYMALERIFDSPTDEGRAARWFSWLLMMILMTVELSYVLVRLMFAPASIHTALVIDDTNAKAEKIAAEAEKRRHATRIDVETTIGLRPPRPPLRIIGSVATP